MEEPSKDKPGLSRRNFLKLAGAGAAGAAGAIIADKLPLGKEKPQSPERIENSSVLVLDFFDLDPIKPKIIKKFFPAGFSEEAELKGMGVTDAGTKEGLQQATPTRPDQAAVFFMKALELQYKDHGKNVVDVLKQASALFAPEEDESPAATSSITEAAMFGDIKYDHLGNPEMQLFLDPLVVQKLVRESDEAIINLSFELGSTTIKYLLYEEKNKHPNSPNVGTVTVGDSVSRYIYEEDGSKTPISEEKYQEIKQKSEEKEIIARPPDKRAIEYTDGYWGDDTYTNLSLMAGLAKDFPNKLFIAAAGNHFTHDGRVKFPDITKARARLEELGEWPENLIMAGYTGIASGREGPINSGASVSVGHTDFDNFGHYPASSYATPIITPATQGIVKSGVDVPAEIEETLKQAYSNEVEYPLLDFNKAQDILHQS